MLRLVKCRYAAFGLIGRLRSSQIEGTGDRVLSEQDTLRAAQHLDALEVKERRTQLTWSAQIDAVNISSDRLLKSLVNLRAHTADEHVGAYSSFTHGEVRYIDLQISNARKHSLVELLA